MKGNQVNIPEPSIGSLAGFIRCREEAEGHARGLFL